VPERPHGMTLASPGARFSARLIDIGAVLLLNAVLNGWFIYRWVQDLVPYSRELMRAYTNGLPLTEVTRPGQLDSLLLVIVLLAFAIWFAYEVPTTAQTGQTLGKRALKIKVVRVENEEPLGFMRAWRRWNPLGWPVMLIYCCGPFFVIPQILDVMFVAIDREKRMALHDRAAATYVVQLPGEPGGKEDQT
jgi:uncharacterized RDD family membrane protein YckC